MLVGLKIGSVLAPGTGRPFSIKQVVGTNQLVIIQCLDDGNFSLSDGLEYRRR